MKCLSTMFVLLFCLLPAAAYLVLAASDENNGGATMERSALAEKKMLELFGNVQSSLEATDPDFIAMHVRLLYGEIAWQGFLDDKMKELITLVVLTTEQTLDGIRRHTEAALRMGATPVEIKEALYQCAPYIGFPKTEEALRLVNEVFAEKKLPLPLESQGTTSEANRFSDGLCVQKAIFGNMIDRMHETTPENQKSIVRDYLSAFCFGDIYTRKGLGLNSRELLTFCILSTLGGCEAQVRAHVQGNLNVGNRKEHLIDALALCMPQIGFPRTLNALNCINAVIPETDSSQKN